MAHSADESSVGARLIALAIGLLAILSSSWDCDAAEETLLGSDFMVRNWQTEDGLPQNTITSILQTRDGYLWLGTFNGLVRFDGVHFTTFNVANSPKMGSDSVVCLFEDRQGQLWVGTDGGGLTRYAQGQFANFVVANRARNLVVSSVAEDDQGVLWAGTDGGLLKLEAGRLEEYKTTAAPEGIGAVQQLLLDGDGRLWVASRSGLFVKSKEGFQRASGYEGLTKLSASRDSGVLVFDGKTGLSLWRRQRVEERFVSGANWKGDFPRSLVHSLRGDVWFGGSEGLTRLRDGKLARYSLIERFGVNSVLALCEDREGNLWVGLNGAGLLCLRETVLETVSTRQGLPDNDVVVLMEEAPGRVWIGGFGLGVGVWENNRFNALPGLPGRDRSVHGLARGAGGEVWVGVREGQLLGWRNEQVFSSEAIPDERARVLFVDREGGLWLGDRLGGVERRGPDQRIARYTPESGLSDGRVTAIAQDKEGAIWVGTKRGVNRIREGKITSFFREQGLGSDCVHGLLVDQQGIVWVGTVGGGLSVLQGDRFATVGAKQGLANEVIGQILDDGSGWLWLGSNAGILRVSREELLACARGELAGVLCRTFGRHEGMLNPECAGSFQPSCFKAHDGRLWFATVGGAVIVDPARLSTNSLPPPVKVETVTADGDECEISRSGALPQRARIPAGTTHVQVAYSGLSFVAPESMRFEYRLAGLDTHWIDAGTRRVAYFNRLPPGKFDFRVRACNSDGIWNEDGARILLIVEPFWWQTSWFRWAGLLGSALVLFTAAWRIHVFRLRRALEAAQRRSAELRAVELGEANHALQARTQELESALANVKTLSGMIPICAGCKKIRDDQGFWEQVELYVSRHSTAKFSHGLCPACTEVYFPGFSDQIDRNKEKS